MNKFRPYEPTTHNPQPTTHNPLLISNNGFDIAGLKLWVILGFIFVSQNIFSQDCADEFQYDHNSPVIVNLNFHFILDASCGGNFRAEDDGDGDQTWTARDFANKMVNDANYTMGHLQPSVSKDCNGMDIPLVPDSKVRFQIFSQPGDPSEGIHFICDQDLYNSKQHQYTHLELKSRFTKYGNSVIDVFVFAWDSTADFLIRGDAMSPGSVHTLWNAWKKYMSEGKSRNIDYSGILMHETGHNMNLRFEAQETACSNYELDPVQEGQNGSNIMRNNGGSANSLTPKQYNIIHEYLVTAGYAKYPDCGLNLPAIVIQPGNPVIWDTKKRIFAELEIPTGATLIVRCDLRTNKKINVRRGGKMIVEACTIWNACPDLWPGIFVEGSTKDHALVNVNPLWGIQQSDDPGVVVLNSAQIKGAVDGITTFSPENPWDRSKWGGIVIATHSTFTDNRRAVAFYPYRFLNRSRFEECTFKSDIGYAGITMWDVHGIEIMDCDFDNLGPGKTLLAPRISSGLALASLNTINGDVGIVAIDATANIYDNCTFKNLTHAIDVKSSINLKLAGGFKVGTLNPTYYPNQFEGNNTHVFSTGVNGLFVHNNRFKTCNEAAYIQDLSDFEFRRNQFSGFQYGLALYNTRNFSNEVYHNKWVSSKTNSVGILAMRDNEQLDIDQNCFDVQLYDIHTYITNGKKFMDQGTESKPQVNLFSHFVGRPDLRNFRAPEFRYWHTDPIYSIPARLIPVCDLNSQCIFKSRHFNVKTDVQRDIEIDCVLGGLTPGPDDDDQGESRYTRYLEFKAEYQSLYQIIDGGNTAGLVAAIQSFPHSAQTMQALMSVSPYLSDEVISKLIESNIDSANKYQILLANKPFPPYLSSQLGQWLAQSSVSQLISDYPALRDSAESLLDHIRFKWVESGMDLLRHYWSESDSDSISLILADIPLSDKRALWFGYKLQFEGQQSLHQWLDSIPQWTMSDSAFILLGKIQMRLLTDSLIPELSPVEDSLLQLYALADIPERSYAQALMFILKGQLYHFVLAEDTVLQQVQVKFPEKNLDENQMIISPQPVSDLLCINMPDVDPTFLCKLQILDMQGLIRILQSYYKPNLDCVATELLNPGMYILKLELADGSILTRNFIKY